MNLLSRDVISTDVLVDGFAMFLIIAEGIEDLSQGEVGKPPDDFFRGDAKLPQFSDGSYRSAGACHNGSPAENLFGADNVGMACRGGHDANLCGGCPVVSLLEVGGEVNLSVPLDELEMPRASLSRCELPAHSVCSN